MPTSSITKNFIIEGKEQIEMFAQDIEESYQDSLKPKEALDIRVVHIKGPEAVRRFLAGGEV